MSILSKAGQRIARAIRAEDGAATVEFVCVIPFFIGIFLSAFEVAAMNIRAVSLERATDVAVRAIRLNASGNIPYDDVLADICNNTYGISNCTSVVKLELQPVSTTTWNLPSGQVDCIKRNETIQPAAKFTHGVQNELMLVRVCAVVDPFFPNIGVGRSMPKDASGGYMVIATSAFVNEPD